MTSRYRWVVLAVGAFGAGAFSMLRMGLPSLGPALREAYGLSLAEVGLVFTSIAVGVTVTLVPWGLLTDRVGERPVLAGGLAGTALALVGAALAPGYLGLLGGLLVAGALGASTTGASGRAVMGWFARTERGMALGVRQMALPLGGGLASATLPWIAGASGVRGALLALAGASAVGAVAAAVWMRDAPPATPLAASYVAPPPMRDGRMWRLGAASALLVLGQSALLGFVVLFLVDEHGMSPASAALVLAAIQLVSAVTRIAIGRWSDRTERRIVPLRHAGLVGAALVALAAALAGAPNVVLVPLLIAGGAAMSSWNGLAFTAAAEIAGRARAGTAMSLQNTLVSVLGIVASPLFGFLVEVSSYQLAYLSIVAAPLAGWWVLRPLESEEERRVEARERRLAAYAATP